MLNIKSWFRRSADTDAESLSPLSQSTQGGPFSGAVRVLVAEDSDESFQLFQLNTMEEGYEITRVTNGMEAVSAARLGKFDFIVMDATMPKLNGYEATRIIREWETTESRTRLPILLFSSDSLENNGAWF
jgi:CheY-like chemotaxis protein